MHAKLWITSVSCNVFCFCMPSWTRNSQHQLLMISISIRFSLDSPNTEKIRSSRSFIHPENQSLHPSHYLSNRISNLLKETIDKWLLHGPTAPVRVIISGQARCRLRDLTKGFVSRQTSVDVSSMVEESQTNAINVCTGEKSQTSYNIILYNIFLHSVHWLHKNAVPNIKRNATNAYIGSGEIFLDDSPKSPWCWSLPIMTYLTPHCQTKQM